VQVCERWIVAALRNRKFFSLTDLNQAIRELLVRMNERPFRKRDGSRASLFHSLEKPALAPLPAERFDMSQWSRATVNIDYHIAFDGNFYSVPYALCSRSWKSVPPRHGGDLSQGQPDRFPPAQSQAGSGHHQNEHRPRVIRLIWSGRHRGW